MVLSALSELAILRCGPGQRQVKNFLIDLRQYSVFFDALSRKLGSHVGDGADVECIVKLSC